MAVFQRLMLCFSILLISACSTLEQGKKLNSNEPDAFKRFVKVLNVGELREIELNQNFDKLVHDIELIKNKYNQNNLNAVVLLIKRFIDNTERIELSGKKALFVNQLLYVNEGDEINNTLLTYAVGKRLGLPLDIVVSEGGISIVPSYENENTTLKNEEDHLPINEHFKKRVLMIEEVMGIVYEGVALRAFRTNSKDKVNVLSNLKKATQLNPKDLLSQVSYQYFLNYFKEINSCDELTEIADKLPSLGYTNYYAYECLNLQPTNTQRSEQYANQFSKIRNGFLQALHDWSLYSPPGFVGDLSRTQQKPALMLSLFRANGIDQFKSNLLVGNRVVDFVLDVENASFFAKNNAAFFFSVPYHVNHVDYKDGFLKGYFSLLLKSFSASPYKKDEDAYLSEVFEKYKVNAFSIALIFASVLEDARLDFKFVLSKGSIAVKWKEHKKWEELSVGTTLIEDSIIFDDENELVEYTQFYLAQKKFVRRTESINNVSEALSILNGIIKENRKPQQAKMIILREEILSEIDGRRQCDVYTSSLAKKISSDRFYFNYSNCLYNDSQYKNARLKLSKVKKTDIRAKLLDIKLDMAEQKNVQALAKLEKLKGQAPKEYDSKINDLLIRLKK